MHSGMPGMPGSAGMGMPGSAPGSAQMGMMQPGQMGMMQGGMDPAMFAALGAGAGQVSMGTINPAPSADPRLMNPPTAPMMPGAMGFGNQNPYGSPY